MITTHLKVRTLEQAWLGIMIEIMDRGREYAKDGGSRAGLLRKALDLMVVEISHPEERPLVPLAKPGCISPCTEDDAEKYLREYLYNTEAPAPCLRMIDTRIIRVECPECDGTGLTIDQGESWRVKLPCKKCSGMGWTDRLHYYVWFRAWNHFGAFPLNMAGIQLLKEVHCTIIEHEAGKSVHPGPTVAISKDSHVNSIEWEAANAWLGR